MPAKSQAQRAYLNAHFGHAWVKRHHFDNKGKLPAKVGKGKTMKHTGKMHRGSHHMHLHHGGGKLPSHGAHQANNKAHGTPAGFLPKPHSHRMGEPKSSHLGKNCEMC